MGLNRLVVPRSAAMPAPDLEIFPAIRIIIIAVGRLEVEIDSGTVAVPEDAAIAVGTCAGN